MNLDKTTQLKNLNSSLKKESEVASNRDQIEHEGAVAEEEIDENCNNINRCTPTKLIREAVQEKQTKK